jgi:hypothetical protein
MSPGRRKKPFKLKLKKHTLYTISSVFLFSLAAIIIFSFSRQGAFLAKLFSFLSYYFGWGVLFLPFLLIAAGLMLARLQWKITRPNVFVGSAVLSISIISLTRAGIIGSQIWHQLAFLISSPGAFFVIFGFVFIGFLRRESVKSLSGAN